MKHLVVITGAGISAESGLKTFRDADGLWEGHNIKEVASPIGFKNNPELVLDFYNQRRRQLKEVVPNSAHHALKTLEETFKVSIITQNVDDLHERANSKTVIHLHGELKKVKPIDKELFLDWEDDLQLGDVDERGVQLRPHVVWFGEQVPMIEAAISVTQTADILLIIGTSMQVYPAAGLIDVAPINAPVYIIDPNPIPTYTQHKIHHIQATATEGMKAFLKIHQNIH